MKTPKYDYYLYVKGKLYRVIPAHTYEDIRWMEQDWNADFGCDWYIKRVTHKPLV